MLDTWVVAADNGAEASYLPGLDHIKQRVKCAAKCLQECFNGETCCNFDRAAGDFHTSHVSRLEGLDGDIDHLSGLFHGAAVFERNMGCTGKFCLVGGGDEAGGVAGCGLHQTRHDTLVINHHGVHCSGDDGQLGHQVVSGHGDSLPHEQLISRTAESADIDSFSTGLFCPLDHLRFTGSRQDHFGNNRIMAMDQDIDLLLFQDAEIRQGF